MLGQDPFKPSVMRAPRFKNSRPIRYLPYTPYIGHGSSPVARISNESTNTKIPDIPPYAVKPPPPRLRLVKDKPTQIDANMLRPYWVFRSRLGRTRLRTLCLRKRLKTDTGGILLFLSSQHDARMIRPHYGFKSRFGHIPRNINT